MAKVGISVRVDVTKIDKQRLYKGEKGTYLDMTTFIDLDNKDQYDNNGFIAQSVSKEEREQGQQGAILGNVKVFFTDNQPSQPTRHQDTLNSRVAGETYDDPAAIMDDDIPF